MSNLLGWRTYIAKQKARCPCGRPFCEVAPNVIMKVRPKPELRAVGERHFSLHCENCKSELDVLVAVA